MREGKMWLLRIIAVVLVAVGLFLAVGGVVLATLGGSLYYLLAGVACTVAGGLLFFGRRAGWWLYLLTFVATCVWALAEVGADFWQLLPRLGGPLVLMLVLLTPWVRRPLGMVAANEWRWWRIPVLAGGAAVLLAVMLLWPKPLVSLPLPGPQPATNWGVYGGDDGGRRHSPAVAITPDNVHMLGVAWSTRTGDLPADGMPQMFEATPLQIGDTLYLCTPHDIVLALDADTGAERWRYDPQVDGTGVYTVTCRGVAYHRDAASAEACATRILVATIDGRLIAVDAANGRPCADFGKDGVVSLRKGLGKVAPGMHFTTSPATIIDNVAVVGSFVLDNMGTHEPSGVIRAFDVKTGTQLWTFDAAASDPNWTPGPDQTFTPGSPNAWSLFSADPELGLVYIPMGNPTPDHFGGHRSPEMDRYGSSVLALEARSGKLVWAFETVHHDLWDYDIASQPVLADVPVNGKKVPALIQATKQGEIFLLDRRTGKPLAPVEERPVPQGDVPGERYAPTQPVSHAFQSLVPPPLREADMWGATPLDQMLCRIAFRKFRYEGRYTPPGLTDTLAYPGNNGMMNWGSVTIDEERGIMVVPVTHMPMIIRLIPRDKAPAGDEITLSGKYGAISPMAGTPYAVRTERPFMSPIGIPCNAPPWGTLVAIDLGSRQILWERPVGTTRDHAPLGIPVPGVFHQGGAMTTKGGLVFMAATLDDYLRAYDVRTGKQLWRARLPAGGQALPMSYVSPRTGRQYVTIAAGGHAFMQTTIGDHVVAYSLGGTDAASAPLAQPVESSR